MSLATRSLLFVSSIFILAMIVRDPAQAHRPPEDRTPVAIATIATDVTR